MIKKLILKSIGLYLNVLTFINKDKGGEKGFNIFCTPLRIKLRPNQLEFLEDAENFGFDYKGKKIAAYKWGSGSTKVLLLHGWQSHSYRWKKFIDLMDKDQFTIYAIDALAQGKSEGRYLNVPIYAELIAFVLRHKMKMDVIMGHSLGSFSAMYSLHNNPDLSPKLFISMASPGNALDFFEFYSGQVGLTDKTVEVIKNHFVKTLNLTPEYFTIERFAASLECPGLIIHDDQDIEADVKYARQAHAVWGKSQLKITSGFGHKLKDISVPNSVIEYINTNLKPSNT